MGEGHSHHKKMWNGINIQVWLSLESTTCHTRRAPQLWGRENELEKEQRHRKRTKGIYRSQEERGSFGEETFGDRVELSYEKHVKKMVVAMM